MELTESKKHTSGQEKASQDKYGRDKHIYINTIIQHKDVKKTDDNNDVYEELHYENKTDFKRIQSKAKHSVCSRAKQYIVIVSLPVSAILFIANLGIGVLMLLPKRNDVTNGGWSDWEPWGICTVTCDYGIVSRRRNCSSPTPSLGGQYCNGDASEYQICKSKPCSVTNGGWSDWEPWGICTVTCDYGIISRRRNCSSPSPSLGGQYCNGDASEYQICKSNPCSELPVNGGWSIWGSWGQCSATCNTGMEHRIRTCSNPHPSKGGNFCFGEPSEYRLCSSATCSAVNGGWSVWTSWSSCSASCMKTRTRACTNPVPSQLGRGCQGNNEDKETCNIFSCVFNTKIYVRLVDGTNLSNGRVEVSLDKQTWGTVCNDNFDASEAEVVCRMLGYTNATVMVNTIADYVLKPIYLDNLQCIGNEISLLHCYHNGWGTHYCSHDEDVGVSCY